MPIVAALPAIAGYAASAASWAYGAVQVASPYIMTATSLASAATSVYSGYQQARTARAMGKAQARLADYNKQVAEAQMKAELQAGKSAEATSRVRATQIRERHRYVKAQQQVALAKSGVVANAGTPLLVGMEEAMEGKLQGLEEIWKGKMQRREHILQANQYASQAAGSEYQGAVSMWSSRISAKQHILSGWGSAAGSLASAATSAGKWGVWNQGNAAGTYGFGMTAQQPKMWGTY